MRVQYIGHHMQDEFMKELLKAHERSCQRAFEVAVRTGTALVLVRNGKVVEIKPPYRYELVKIVTKKKNKYQKRKQVK